MLIFLILLIQFVANNWYDLVISSAAVYSELFLSWILLYSSFLYYSTM